MKKITFILFLICFGIVNSYGVDVRSFINLGFSNDSKYFAFGNYGVDGQFYPHADLFIVDVGQNRFVSRERHTLKGEAPVQLGQDGMHTMNRLLLQSAQLFRTHRINPENTGRLIYLLLDNAAPLPKLEFTDFTSGTEYQVNLEQKSNATGSAFSIFLRRTGTNNAARAWEIGRPNLYRPGIQDYRIRQIILGPNNHSLIFVVEMRSKDHNNNVSSRFMVETLAFNP
jgi:predicted secreted protein